MPLCSVFSYSVFSFYEECENMVIIILYIIIKSFSPSYQNWITEYWIHEACRFHFSKCRLWYNIFLHFIKLLYLWIGFETERKLLPHEAVKILTCTKKISLTRAQPENFLRQRKFIYKPLKNNFCYVES